MNILWHTRKSLTTDFDLLSFQHKTNINYRLHLDWNKLMHNSLTVLWCTTKSMRIMSINSFTISNQYGHGIIAASLNSVLLWHKFWTGSHCFIVIIYQFLRYKLSPTLEALKTWSRTYHPLKRGLRMVSFRNCWNGWKSHRSSSHILVLWGKDEK